MQQHYFEGEFLGAYPTEEISESFSKRLFAIQTNQEYDPKKVFELHKFTSRDNTILINDLSIGDLVRVYFNVVSKEHNGRWFNNIVAWKVESIQELGGKKEAPKMDDTPVEIIESGDTIDDSGDLPF